MRLFLFDIDGTLVRTAGAGRASMERSFEQIYGVSRGFEGVEMMGRTDPSILSEALKNHGLEYEEKGVEAFRELYYSILEHEIEVARPGKQICPGIVELLDAISCKSGIAMGLLTGNWKRSAHLKLHHFKLDTYFPFGAYGDDSALREDLVPVVIERFLRASCGTRLSPKEVYVIGDTPLDVQCARPYGVLTVAVATGFHSVEQLTESKPDFLFANLENTEDVIERLFAGDPSSG